MILQGLQFGGSVRVQVRLHTEAWAVHVCVSHTGSPTVKGLWAIWGFYPHFGFLNEVEWEGGIFFQTKGKGQDGLILFLGKTNKNKQTNKLSLIIRLGCQVP